MCSVPPAKGRVSVDAMPRGGGRGGRGGCGAAPSTPAPPACCCDECAVADENADAAPPPNTAAESGVGDIECANVAESITGAAWLWPPWLSHAPAPSVMAKLSCAER